MPDSRRYFCIIGTKYPDLARKEITALLKTYGSCKVDYSNYIPVVVAEGECEIDKVAKRVVYTKCIAQEIRTDTDYSILTGKTFSCIGDNDGSVIHRVAENIKKRTGAKISLKNPDYQIIVISPYDAIRYPFCAHLIGIRIPQPKIDWKKRQGNNRRFFHPSALEPRLCRAMVNLAEVKEGDTILDPFCGTGSILTEAQEFQIKTAGFDAIKKMCKGAKQNLIENIVQCDSVQMPLKPLGVDAIVTDIPYGRSTSMVNDRSRKQLLKDFVANASIAVKRMVIMCEKGDEDIIISTKTNIKSVCHLYEHKSLTRSIVTITIW
jgi:putative methyltransferase (TIGR01177 family)